MKEFIIEKLNSDSSLVAVLEYDKDTLYLYICNFINSNINILQAINIEFEENNIVESDYKLLWDEEENVKVIYKGNIILDYKI